MRCLSPAAARHLRGRATDDDDTTLAAAEIDEVMGSAEVFLASFWDPVPNSQTLTDTRFPPALKWVRNTPGRYAPVTQPLRPEQQLSACLCPRRSA